MEKCVKICLKKDGDQSKTNVGSTFGKGIEELDRRKTCKYLSIEKSHDIEHKYEKEKLKQENLRMRVLLGTELSAKN